MIFPETHLILVGAHHQVTPKIINIELGNMVVGILKGEDENVNQSFLAENTRP